MAKFVTLVGPMVVCEKAPPPHLAPSPIVVVAVDQPCPYCFRPISDHRCVLPTPETTSS